MFENMQITEILDLEKRVPRYTSYPPANHFNDTVTPEKVLAWYNTIPFGSDISVYVHIPFCRNLCWFCACRTQGIKRRLTSVYNYIDGLKAEIDTVSSKIKEKSKVKFLHLGGGTPTILPPILMAEFLKFLKSRLNFEKDFSFSVEIDPTEIDEERLDVLIDEGLNRASVGVQDFNPLIQKAIGRSQTYDQTEYCFGLLRQRNVKNINVDLLYGLPHQTVKKFSNTIDQVIRLSPHRIAMFGYAHVPWMANRQKLIDSAELPKTALRYALLESGRQKLIDSGFVPVGIDHFTKANDSLAKAFELRSLHRNFQGYTDDALPYLVGFGASSISKFPQGYGQNIHGTRSYLELVNTGKLATSRGYELNEKDQLFSYIIECLMCNFAIDLNHTQEKFGLISDILCSQIKNNPGKFGLRNYGSSSRYEIANEPHIMARLIASQFDQFMFPRKGHSLAV